MGAVEECGKFATGTVEALKSQPLALALVVINVLFLLAGVWFLHTIAGNSSAAAVRRDALMTQLAKDCIVAPKPETPQ